MELKSAAHISVVPWVQSCRVDLERPDLGNNTADVERLKRGLSQALQGKEVVVPWRIWNRLPSILRDGDFSVTAVVFRQRDHWRVLDVLPGSAPKPMYALGVDLGTTTFVCFLLDLDTGTKVAEKTVVNPQIEAGPDILTRIHYAGTGEGLEHLRQMARDGINHAVDTLCMENGIAAADIVAAAVAGNTTMTHFFLGLDPSNIRKEPYIPVVNRPGWIRTRDLGLNLHPESYAFVFPNVGSYFGGDLISGILASGIHRNPEVCFLVDVGTNAEVVLGNSDWLLACAGAAGPALEGGVAKMGMLAGDGAIEHVRIDPDTLEAMPSVIGHTKPVGICGSGLIDLVAELFSTGIIDQRGKIRSLDHPRIVETESGRAYIVAPAETTGHGGDVLISQVDLDILLRSKAAMYTILTTITEEVGLSFGEIRRFYISGTFGTYIDPRMAIRIGMIPDLPLDTYAPLGNSSALGAEMFLSNRNRMKEVEEIADKVTYLELNVNQRFMTLFSAAKFIPHTDPSLFPSVEVTRPAG